MIMSCDMNGKNIKLERNTTEKTGSNVIFGLALSGNRAIISVWFQASLYSTLVEAAAASWKVESEIIGTNELFSIIVVDGSVQETGKVVIFHSICFCFFIFSLWLIYLTFLTCNVFMIF